jgi:hypothetical protein
MKDSPVLRLAVTGALPDSKQAVTTALSLATGVPRIAVSPESLAPGPGRQLGDTVETPVRAFESRLDSEARASRGFISDGSVLQEWVAAEIVRRGRSRWSRFRHPRSIPFRIFEKRFLEAHAGTVARYANNSYDAVLHLRPEPEEGATLPASALLFDRIVMETLHSLRIPYLVTGGSIEKTLAHVVDLFRMPLQMPISEAVATATDASWPDDFPTTQLQIPTSPTKEIVWQ